MVLDTKTLALKYRVELSYLDQISLSSYSDHIFVMHINPVSRQLRCHAGSVDFTYSAITVKCIKYSILYMEEYVAVNQCSHFMPLLPITAVAIIVFALPTNPPPEVPASPIFQLERN